jgi:hypothetical protein
MIRPRKASVPIERRALPLVLGHRESYARERQRAAFEQRERRRMRLPRRRAQQPERPAGPRRRVDAELRELMDRYSLSRESAEEMLVRMPTRRWP